MVARTYPGPNVASPNGRLPAEGHGVLPMTAGIVGLTVINDGERGVVVFAAGRSDSGFKLMVLQANGRLRNWNSADVVVEPKPGHVADWERL